MSKQTYTHSLHHNPQTPAGLALWMQRGARPQHLTVLEKLPELPDSDYWLLSDASVMRVWSTLRRDRLVELGTFPKQAGHAPHVVAIGQLHLRKEYAFDRAIGNSAPTGPDLWEPFCYDTEDRLFRKEPKSFSHHGPFEEMIDAAMILVNQWHLRRNTLAYINLEDETKRIAEQGWVLRCPYCAHADVRKGAVFAEPDLVCASCGAEEWDKDVGERPWQVPTRMLERGY